MAASPLQAPRKMTRRIAGRLTRTLERALGVWARPAAAAGMTSPAAAAAAAADSPSELPASPQALVGGYTVALMISSASVCPFGSSVHPSRCLRYDISLIHSTVPPAEVSVTRSRLTLAAPF